MKTIIHVPIEPISERYTEQWYRKFPEAFFAAGYNVTQIEGTALLENEIKVGAFLDINSTVHYKMTQLQQIAAKFNKGEIEEGSIFFFGDIEFWGIEAVRLMAKMNNVNIKITGFLHAASYTKEDAFAVAEPFQKYTEVGWIAALDKVFVGSQYHKDAVIERRLKPIGAEALADKIKVTKNPIFVDEYETFRSSKKRKKILLTNRFDHEKRPAESLYLFEQLKHDYPDWEFVVTTGRPKIRGTREDMQLLERLVREKVVTVAEGLTKSQYHRHLSEAYMVVSHSIEENYGYCIAESIHYGCVPLLRDGLSHNEFVTRHYTFVGSRPRPGSQGALVSSNVKLDYSRSDYDMAVHWIERFEEPRPVITLDVSGMQNIINEIKTL